MVWFSVVVNSMFEGGHELDHLSIVMLQALKSIQE